MKQESQTWSIDDAREDFTFDVYTVLDFLPTNNEANQIIDSFDKVTSNIGQYPVLDKIRAEIIDTGAYEQEIHGKTEFLKGINYCLDVINRYRQKGVNKNE